MFLQAHINHRHIKPSSTATVAASTTVSTVASSLAQTHIPVSRDPRDPRGHLQVDVSHQPMLVGHLQHSTQEHREAVDHTRNSNISMGSPAGQSRQYPHSPASYPSQIPVSSTRPNLITVPIQDDGVSHPTGATPHLHPQTHVPPAYVPSTAATAPPPHPMPTIQHPGTAYTPHAYQHPTPSSAYSQAPPITTPTFSQPPPPVHHQPPLHQPGSTTGSTIYTITPPPVHHQPPATYTPPRAPAPRPPMHPPPPHFHEEGAASYIPQWGAPGSTVPPPPARASLPPRPLAAPPPSAPNLLQPRGPADAAYRQPYYQ